MDKPVTAENYQIRISPEAFVVRINTRHGLFTTNQDETRILANPCNQIALALFLAIAFIFTVLRTVARLNQHGRLYLDDYFVFYAVIASAACGGVAYSIRDQIYLQIYVGLGWQAPAADFQDQMLIFEKRIMACSALIWSVIYAIKFSFLAFFRKLVDRVWKLEIYWWIVVAITTACGITSIPLSFIICAHFGNDYISNTPSPPKKKPPILLELLTKAPSSILPSRLPTRPRTHLHEHNDSTRHPDRHPPNFHPHPPPLERAHFPPTQTHPRHNALPERPMHHHRRHPHLTRKPPCQRRDRHLLAHLLARDRSRHRSHYCFIYCFPWPFWTARCIQARPRCCYGDTYSKSHSKSGWDAE